MADEGILDAAFTDTASLCGNIDVKEDNQLIIITKGCVAGRC